MKKNFLIICAMIGVFSTTGCGSTKTPEAQIVQEPTIVATYEETSLEKIDECFENEIEYISTTYYEMSDGTWQAEDYSYQYRLEVTGRMNAAVKDTTYIILSNTKDITFEQAWKASGLSSSMSDYFKPEDAKIVGMISKETITAEQWGVIFSAESITPSGMMLQCTQSGGNPTGELSTGTWYVLEQFVNGSWEKLEYLPREYDVAWEDIGWIIPMEETVEWKVNWEWLYGELPAGEYRIGKEIMDWREAGDFDKVILYAEFEIN